jgi:hypothetical protein
VKVQNEKWGGKNMVDKTLEKMQTIESELLRVTIDDTFPRVVRYEFKSNGAILYGQEDILSQITINGNSYTPSVSFSKTADTAYYSLTISSINVMIDMNFKVVDNVLQMNVASIAERGSTKVYTIDFPNHSLVSIRTTQPNARESATNLYIKVWEKSSDDEFNDLSTMEIDASPVGRTYVILNTDQLAAAIDNNTIDVAANQGDIYQRYLYQTVDKGSYKKCGLWNNTWTYREIGSEITELPWSRIIITGDENGDGVVDWQDGAIGYRRNMAEPLGADIIRSSVFHGSNAVRDIIQWPFVRVLDNLKKLYLNMDGFNQFFMVGGIFRGNAVMDWDQNYEDKAGGLTDLNLLIDRALDYNCTTGCYVNQTEVYQEELCFDDSRTMSSIGWNYFDESRNVDRRYDLTTTDRPVSYRLDALKANIPNLKFLFFDAYFEGIGWDSWKLAKTVNDKGFLLVSEFAAMEREMVLSIDRHIDSKIVRFIRNHVCEMFTSDPLLKSPKNGLTDANLMGDSGDGRPFDLYHFMEQFSTRILPVKYMQQSPIKKWENTRVDFENHSYVVKESDTVKLYSKDGKKIASGAYSTDPAVVFDKVFIPWDLSSETKIYHMNTAGGNSTWSLPNSWSGTSTVKLYKLTDLGKVFVSDVAVSGGSVTIKAAAKTPYVIYRTVQSNPAITWGEGSLVKDPGFNSHGFSSWSKTSTYRDTGHITIKNNNLGLACLHIEGNNGADAMVSQNITGLTGGKTYVASVWVDVTSGRKAVIGVKDYGGPEVTNWVTKTDVTCYWRETDKRGTTYQRMKVYFDVPEGYSTAALYLKADPGTPTSRVMFDDVRLVETTRTPQGSHYFFEDFENVDEGWGPFVAGGYQDGACRTHLSRCHAGYTTDTINGNLSLKTRNEPVADEEIYRTLPSMLRLAPNTTYTMSFLYMEENDRQYSVVVRTDHGGPGQEKLNAALSSSDASFCQSFTTGNFDDYYVAVVKNDGSAGTLVIDDFAIDLGVLHPHNQA